MEAPSFGLDGREHSRGISGSISLINKKVFARIFTLHF